MVTRFPGLSFLVALNVAWFVQQLLIPADWLAPLELWPEASGMFRPWQLVTYSMLHANPFHLAMNMLGLVMFGAALESSLGRMRFACLYLGSAVGAAGLQLLATSALGLDPRPTIGASGAVFGMVVAFGLMFPMQRIFWPLPPVPMRAGTLAILAVLLELLMAAWRPADGVAHFAHLGGMASGGWMLFFWRATRSRVTP